MKFLCVVVSPVKYYCDFDTTGEAAVSRKLRMLRSSTAIVRFLCRSNAAVKVTSKRRAKSGTARRTGNCARRDRDKGTSIRADTGNTVPGRVQRSSSARILRRKFVRPPLPGRATGHESRRRLETQTATRVLECV